ncbi:hypothetical protein C1Y63_11115 [Corynebacterium sp. 13CS0277]|uniref:DUF418 domain-containing protein n=1 Tax=Corynebacterium sp. 13CS0277 TaxID=2071994 RepID=UPI000D038822|nr:DUF418 domain-containing protein [Corynebacterium sp. 13CS0277]PRQ10528.1 hypothetical protein C1Y63_11115 [Corynebacterium sp. 13CS0277]
MTEPHTTTTSAPVRPRLITPDVARGLTLLSIAVANVTTAWAMAGDVPAGRYGGIVDGSMADTVAVFLGCIFTHVRGLAMFSLLLGYGLGMLCDSLQRRSYPVDAARWVLLRRYGLLALFGAVHCVALFWGDIMLFYGLAGMLLTAMITLRTKVLWWIAGVMFLLSGLLTVPAAGLFFQSDTANQAADTYLQQVVLGLGVILMQAFMLPVELLALFPLMLVGVIASRYRILDNPAAYTKVLVPVASAGGVLALVLGVLMAAGSAGLLPVNDTLVESVNQWLGVLTGPAILAAIALACIPLQRRITAAAARGEHATMAWPVQMLVALGRRSMSGYIAQSLLFTVLVAPYGLYLGVREGAFEGSVMGVIVWLITLVAAFLLDRAGLPGPCEALHRRWSYGKQGLPKDYFLRQVDNGHPIPYPEAARRNLVDAQGRPLVPVY